jgi:transcriptional regulator with XRE-family HTH domain
VTPSESAAPTEIIFATNLKAARIAAGLSQEEFARRMTRLGVKWHQATVYKVESTDRQIQLGEAVVAARVLRVPLEQLVREDADAPNWAARAARLSEFHWALVNARSDLIEAVHHYGQARKALADALTDDYRLPADQDEEIRRDVQLAAIRDWPRVRAADAESAVRNPPLQESAIESET